MQQQQLFCSLFKIIYGKPILSHMFALLSKHATGRWHHVHSSSLCWLSRLGRATSPAWWCLH